MDRLFDKDANALVQSNSDIVPGEVVAKDTVARDKLLLGSPSADSRDDPRPRRSRMEKLRARVFTVAAQGLPADAGDSFVRRTFGWPVALAALLVASGCASAAPDWREVRLVRDRADVQGCKLLTILKDDDMNDLRKRAVESGGDTVLVTGSEEGKVPILTPTRFVADVYRCRTVGSHPSASFPAPA
jgi:hypothetical protein